MTEITREELELCAELLGVTLVSNVESYNWRYVGMAVHSGNPMNWRNWNPITNGADREALAKAAKLIVNHRDDEVGTPDGEYLFLWPMHGAYAECVIKAAAAMARSRKQT